MEEERRTLPKDLRLKEVDNDLMRCWINGCTEDVAKSLLRRGAPVFVIQVIDQTEPARDPLIPNFDNFYDGTSVVALTSNRNPIDILANDYGSSFADLTHDSNMSTLLSPTSSDDRARSSSHNQGWIANANVNPKIITGSKKEVTKGSMPVVVEGG